MYNDEDEDEDRMLCRRDNLAFSPVLESGERGRLHFGRLAASATSLTDVCILRLICRGYHYCSGFQSLPHVLRNTMPSRRCSCLVALVVPFATLIPVRTAPDAHFIWW